MKKLKSASLSITLTLIVVFSLIAVSLPVSAQPDKIHVELPFEEEGTLNRADYRIRVPDNWNGTLLVYAHGFLVELPPPPVQIAPGWGPASTEEALLALGYGLAGSSFRDGGLGWAVKDGIQNLLALTNYVKGHVGQPEHVIIWGNSMGSVIALKSIEKYPDIYDGAVAESGLNAGTPMQKDSMLALRLAYGVTFGWHEDWGPVGDVRDDINFMTDVAPIIFPQMYVFPPPPPPDPWIPNPANYGKGEFVRLVVDYPEEAFWAMSLWGIPWSILSFMFAFGAVENDAQNLDHVYSLTEDEIAYLESHGVAASSLLAEMNDMTNIEASIPARKYVERYAEYSGDITGPVITLHNRADPLCHVANNGVYRDTVEAAGKGDLLLQVYTDMLGHGFFTATQYVLTVEAMKDWLDTGIRPNPPDSASFPASAGFIPGFVPPPWPFEE